MTDFLTTGFFMTDCRATTRMRIGARFARWFIAAAASVWIGTIDPTRAAAEEILFSSIDGDTSESIQLGVQQASYWRYAAQQFRTEYSNELTEVSLHLFRLGSTAGSFNIEVWSNAGGNVPGSLQQTLVSNYNFLSVPASPQTISFEVSSTLSKFTNYWIVIDAQNVAGGNLQWVLTNDSSGPGVADRPTLRNADDSSSWQTSFAGNYGRMEVVAVPEPDALPVAGLGLLGAWWAVQRLKRRDSTSAGA